MRLVIELNFDLIECVDYNRGDMSRASFVKKLIKEFKVKNEPKRIGEFNDNRNVLCGTNKDI